MRLKFHTKPWVHQIKAMKYFMPREYGALYTDMGSGKTKVMVDLIVNRGFNKVLIVCPKKVCNVWPGEFIKHAPNCHICVIDVSNIVGKEKSTRVRESVANKGITQQVIIINYESVWRSPFREFLLKYKLDCIICDESHKIKSPGSKCSRFLTLLGKRVDNRFLMTGTPLGQSPMDIYAQYRFLDPTIFGTNFATFKDRYCNLIKVAGGFYSVLNKKEPYKNLDELHEKMFSCAFKSDTNIKLPDTQDIMVEFFLSQKAEVLYKELQKEGCLELSEGTLETGNILAIITRLQQLVSGYIPLTNDEGERTLTQVDTSRQDTLRELLEDLPDDEPVVIFAKYRKDINNIRNIVKSMGRKSSELSGKSDTLHRWKEGKTTVLVVQISSGAEGIDLTRARYCIYYTLTPSLIQYEQSRKRIHRPGQNRPVVYYTLVAKMKKGKTVDEKIVDSLKNNKSIVDSIMEDREI